MYFTNFDHISIDKTQEEFLQYQLLISTDIPESVKTEAEEVIMEGKDSLTFNNMDVIWSYLSKVKCSDGSLKFGNLCKVAFLVLVLLHSNGGEGVFSQIKKIIIIIINK